jgi:transcriptional regulator with XRE-family HTH domain
MSTFGQRLRIAIEQHQQITLTTFCERTGFSQSMLSHYLAGLYKPGLDSIVKIVEALPGTNIGWLLTGKSTAA